ncbi:thioredoxin-dependent thiol peroxidase [Rodentibacter caecimuris]|uniref:thioredoxin-dependent peroxiredoxin n=1 Tax=Rodentibacter caecimuris TaxID=1796644 RepID=A0ABX3KYV2_9PAST|nr:thioredoxin-dependent thiol peroxidase [Rodentibacter heylii]
MTQLKIGDLAPTFTLFNQNNVPVSLSQFKGQKTLIYFYPKALTPGCTTQACHLQENRNEFAKLGVAVIGISPDTPKKLAQFSEKKSLNFILLSDENHQVATQFGVWGEKKFMGKTFDGIHRISFLLDEQGKILHIFDKFKTTNHHQIVLDYLSSL